MGTERVMRCLIGFFCSWSSASNLSHDRYVFSQNSLSSYSILPALSLDGVLTVDIIEGSFTMAKFAWFINGLLGKMNPFPAPNSVIIMDNCCVHKSNTILDMIVKR